MGGGGGGSFDVEDSRAQRLFGSRENDLPVDPFSETGRWGICSPVRTLAKDSRHPRYELSTCLSGPCGAPRFTRTGSNCHVFHCLVEVDSGPVYAAEPYTGDTVDKMSMGLTQVCLQPNAVIMTSRSRFMR